MGGGQSAEKEQTDAQHAIDQAKLALMTPEAAASFVNNSSKDKEERSSTAAAAAAAGLYGKNSFVAYLRAPPPRSVMVEPPLAGLTNYGNTCYANSVLQMLFHTPTFRHHIATVFVKNAFLDIEKNKSNNNNNNNNNHAALTDTERQEKQTEWKETVWAQLAGLYSKMALAAEKANKEKGAGSSGSYHSVPVIGPKDFLVRVGKGAPMFANNEQHDAHEFALNVLNMLFDEEKRFDDGGGSSNNSGGGGGTLQDMVGTTVTQTSCIECDTMTIVKEKLVDVSCVLDTKSSLRHIAEFFTSYEMLTGENKFRCDACANSNVARRRTIISSPAPKFLLMQLKRFRYSQSHITKLVDFIPFSDRLRVPVYDEKQRVIGSQRYRLCAFVVHQGLYPSVGHYFCIAYHRPSKQWLQLNDVRAQVITERERMRFLGHCTDLQESRSGDTTAYLLSYERDDSEDEVMNGSTTTTTTTTTDKTSTATSGQTADKTKQQQQQQSSESPLPPKLTGKQQDYQASGRVKLNLPTMPL